MKQAGSGMTKKQQGNRGETIAARYLESRGFFIIMTKYYTRYGEIDIVAQDRSSSELVFVEVKTRTSTQYGWPEESVDARKKQRWLRSARVYLETMQERSKWQRYRFDIIAILIDGVRRKAQVTHFKNIAITP